MTSELLRPLIDLLLHAVKKLWLNFIYVNIHIHFFISLILLLPWKVPFASHHHYFSLIFIWRIWILYLIFAVIVFFIGAGLFKLLWQGCLMSDNLLSGVLQVHLLCRHEGLYLVWRPRVGNVSTLYWLQTIVVTLQDYLRGYSHVAQTVVMAHNDQDVYVCAGHGASLLCFRCWNVVVMAVQVAYLDKSSVVVHDWQQTNCVVMAIQDELL